MSAADYQHNPNYVASQQMPDDLQDLAYEVFSVPSTNHNEASMILWLSRVLDDLQVEYYIDDYGNMLVAKGAEGAGNYPCFCAHLDTVHMYPNGFNVNCDLVEGRDYLYAVDDANKRVGVGGDDKCGIFACVHLLTKLERVKVVFFSQEESGGTGSSNVDMDFFKDCKFFAGIDRWNGHDVINNYGGSFTTSKAFRKATTEIFKTYDYKGNSGFFTDVFNVQERGVGISCMNLSCGYYCHHTEKEYVDLNELYHCCLLCEELAALPGTYYFTPPPLQYKKGSWKGSTYNKHTNRWDPYDDDDDCSYYKYLSKAEDRHAWWSSSKDTPAIKPIPTTTLYSTESFVKCDQCGIELLSWEIRQYKNLCYTCHSMKREVDISPEELI